MHRVKVEVVTIMFSHRPSRPIVATLLLTLTVILLWHHPEDLRHTLETAIALWWNHIVPILMPSYVLNQAFWYLLPTQPYVVLWALSLCTFPPLSAVVLYDLKRQGAIPSNSLHLTLLYTNLYNPLLFPYHTVGLALDVSLTAAALIISPQWLFPSHHSAPRISSPRSFHPRTWVLDGMNWTTIMGLGIAMALLIHDHLPGDHLGWLVDPLAILWMKKSVLTVGTLFWLSFGGLIYWIPLLWLMPSTPKDRLRWLLYRLTQTLLAITFFPLVTAMIR